MPNQLAGQDASGQLAVEDVGGEVVVGDEDDAEGEETPIRQQRAQRQGDAAERLSADLLARRSGMKPGAEGCGQCEMQRMDVAKPNIGPTAQTR